MEASNIYIERKEDNVTYDRLFTKVFMLDQQPWDEYRVENVSSNIEFSYDDKFLYLKFTSEEQRVEARYRGYNGNVHKDNCVEFFVRFDSDEIYYNFEVNILGNIKMAYGKDRFSRKFLPVDVLETIERSVIIEPVEKAGELYLRWCIGLKIAANTFIYHNLDSLGNHRMFGNFYQCGDDLKQAYYLCWNYISTDKPDFHRPEFFRLLNTYKEI